MKISLPRPLSLFLLTLALVLLGLGLRFGLPIYRQQMAIREVRRLGGDVIMEMNGPEWLCDHIPHRCQNLFGSVRHVDLGTRLVTDADLALLKSFSELDDLYLAESRVTDVGLRQVSELECLERLWLNDTLVTDAGLEYLARSPRLVFLNVMGSAVTEDGTKKLYAAVPHIFVVGPRCQRFHVRLVRSH